MRALIQRVLQASVSVDGDVVGQIQEGYLLFLGVGHGDTQKQVSWLVEKVIHLRLFEDEAKKMSLSLLDKKGEVLVVSQFTLYADCSQGRRPSFIQAAKPEEAIKLYHFFIHELKSREIEVQAGVFGAEMQVSLVNNGPVTILLETPN